MKIVFNDDRYVVGYADEGLDMNGSEEFSGEIPEGFGPTTFRYYYESAPGILTLDNSKQQAVQDFEAAQDELQVLYRWFSWYDVQLMQALRAERMGEAFSAVDADGNTYADINELDAQATIYQLRIRELKRG